MIVFGDPLSPKNISVLRILPRYRGDRSKFTRQEVEFAMNVARSEGAKASVSVTAEGIARLIAIAGLGTTDGGSRSSPPNESWTAEAWNARVLECIPAKAEAQCRALAEQIMEFIGG